MPYYHPGQANGFAFSVNTGISKPRTLIVIEKEIRDELNKENLAWYDCYLEGCDDIEALDREFISRQAKIRDWQIDRTLRTWREQGIFLTNTALTVEIGRPNSHRLYWQNFMKGIIEVISREVNPIWVLWGLNAKGYINNIKSARSEDDTNILTAPHPVVESPDRNGGFYGCNHFIKINEILIKQGKKPIDWLT